MQQFIVLSAIIGALGVGLGAFGAHGLSAILEANGRADTFSTGTLYHLVHAVVILGIGILGYHLDSQLLRYAGYFILAGIILFSGSLYILSIFDIRIMGAVAPLGGTAFIIGWILIGVAAMQSGS